MTKIYCTQANQGRRKDSGAELQTCPQPECHIVFKPEIHKHLCQVTVTFSHLAGTGIFLKNRSLWYTSPVPTNWVIQLLEGDLPIIHVSTCQPGCQLPTYTRTCFFLPSRMSVTQGGLGKLNPYSKWNFYSKWFQFGSFLHLVDLVFICWVLPWVDQCTLKYFNFYESLYYNGIISKEKQKKSSHGEVKAA